MTESVPKRGKSKKRRSNLPNQKVISHSTYPYILFFSNSHLFSLSLFPLQSSCQPATSSGAAMAASWQETAPSVSALTALRSARTGRAAEVGFSCAGGAPPVMEQPLVSLCPRPDFHQKNKQEVLPIWEPSVCRLQAGPHVQITPPTQMHTHTKTVYTKRNYSAALSLCAKALASDSQEDDNILLSNVPSRVVVSYLDSAYTLNEQHGRKLQNYAGGKGLTKYCFLDLIMRKSGF